MTLDPVELALIDDWQRDFPLVPRPFAVVGRAVGIGEADAIEAYARLLAQGVLSRIGAVVRPHSVGASTLAAMRVPPERLDEVAAVVSRAPLVSHNYARSHDVNLWFVVAGPDAAAVATTLDQIRAQTGLAVLDLPLQRAYHLDLGFALRTDARRRRPQRRCALDHRPDASDRGLLAAIEDGLPLSTRPYGEVAAKIGLAESEVIARLRRLVASGVVTRFGCVVRHRALGYCANAMVVWDVPVEHADEAAQALVRNGRVTLCYRRSRHLPEWPYNLYCMVHARSRPEALAVVGELDAGAGLAGRPKAVLFSARCFKQRGAVFSSPQRSAS